ncbi:PAS domain-containing protein [Halalkalibacter akibai]|uniref:Blue-light photoreceptor n=1 Tax=Halalkalibacter akibai (strain ATCC 43226 / DSM 21942 / CIP 109018 / JCM 9157 / 1139) TaxID=1236973 RepID=W4QXV7_HALA3|nr:PAS domain-containing protein [Halalkalibacter akibai]GAE36911.1 blue-light photoreceptor [Halalkalibacter akibai JCM 9157]
MKPDFFQKLIDHSPDIILILNGEGEYHYINETTELILGCDKEEWLGRHFSESPFMTEESRHFCLHAFPDIVAGKRLKDFTVTAITSEQEQIPFKVNVHVIDTLDSLFLFIVLEDVTRELELRKEKESLLERNNLLAKAIDYSGIGVLITDIRKKNNPIMYVNKGFEQITGYTQSEVLGKNCNLLQGKDTSDLEINKIKQAIEQEKRINTEILKLPKRPNPLLE